MFRSAVMFVITLFWVDCGSQSSTGITSWLLESRGATFFIFFGLGMVSFVGKGQVALLKVLMDVSRQVLLERW